MQLAIAIPTFNRCEDLVTCLESFRAAWKPEFVGRVELIISSNASTDGTGDVVRNFSIPDLPLQFHEWPENVGPIRNFFKLVELSSSDFCWFLSDDDAIEADAIGLVLDHLDSGTGGILLKSTAWSSDLQEIVHQPSPFSQISNILEPPFGREAVRELLHDWGLLSVCVFRRDLWNRFAPQIPLLEAGFYPHVWILSMVLEHSGKWIVIRHPTVRYRCDRDSFLLNNGLRRGLMAIDSYGALANHFKTTSPVISSQGLRLCCEFTRYYSLKTKSNWIGAETRQPLASLKFLLACIKFGGWKCPTFYTQALVATAAPAPLIKALKRLKNKLTQN